MSYITNNKAAWEEASSIGTQIGAMKTLKG